MKIKGMDKDMKCRGFQFEVGKEYKIEHKGKIELCSNTVFHYCDSLQKVHEHYSCNEKELNRFFEIEVLGEEVTDGQKCGSDHIKIVREIMGDELAAMKGMVNGNTGLFNTGDWNTGDGNTGDGNTGDGNTGNGNTGDRNTGYWNTGNGNTDDWNTGNRNTGDWNTGDRNTGYGNTGNRNTGNRNTGDWNTGYRNTGDWNTGDWNTGNGNTGDGNTGDGNTGDWNTGDRNTGNGNTGDGNTGNGNTGNRNTGNRNTGNRNTGYRNTGDWNTGYRNTGDWNTGDWNTGNGNTGDGNTGYRNTGDRNTGDWNTGYGNTIDYSNGVFCTKPDMNIRIFNKPSGMSLRDFYRSKYYEALCRAPFLLTDWIPYTEEEKKADPNKEMIGGYLKEYTMKEAWANWWKEMSEENKRIVQEIPNFDAKIFKEITGIEV